MTCADGKESNPTPTTYAWTKEFMEAGKERLTRDSVRDATRLRGYVNRCVNDIRRRPSQPLIQWSTFGSDVLVPVFDVAEKSYAISVANDITKVSIIPTKRSTDHTIQYRSSLTCNTCQWTDYDSIAAGLQDDLGVGESTFVVEVTRTTPSGKTQYVIVITRAAS